MKHLARTSFACASAVVVAFVVAACSSSGGASAPPPDGGDGQRAADGGVDAPPEPSHDDGGHGDDADAAVDATTDAPAEPGKSVHFNLTRTGPGSLVCVNLAQGTYTLKVGCEYALSTDLRFVLDATSGYVDVSGPVPDLCPIDGTFASLADAPKDYAPRCSSWYASLLKQGGDDVFFVKDAATGAHHFRVRAEPNIVGDGAIVIVHYDAID